MKRSQPEDTLQRTVVSHIQARGVPGLVFWHTPNSSKLGGKRVNGIPLEAIRLKKLGLRAGVSDLMFVHDSKIFAMELKVRPNKPTESQLTFLSDLERAGGYTSVCYDVDTALDALFMWGLIK